MYCELKDRHIRQCARDISNICNFFFKTNKQTAAASSPSHGISKAKVILDEMERITQSAPKDLRTANAFLCVCEAAGDWELAIATLNGLDHMRLDNSPNGAGINTNFKPSDALAWIPEFSPSLTPDSFSFNTALGACREAGQWNAAKELLQRMKDHGPPPDLVRSPAACFIVVLCLKGGSDQMWWERKKEGKY